MVDCKQPTVRKTFTEYGLRFDIEEGLKYDKSGTFKLESSKLRDTEALAAQTKLFEN